MPEGFQIKHSLTLLLFVAAWHVAETVAFAQTTAFTYQGRLTDASNPADGLVDMQFKLFNTPDVGTGTQQGSTITNSSVQVTKGVFSVMLDFGNVFDGSARFLELSLRPAGTTNPRTVLSPRQPLTSTPYAVRSLTASNTTQFSGLNPSSFVQFNGSGNVGIGTTTPQTKLEVLTATNSYGFTHTDGTIKFGSYVNGLSAPPGGWFGTQSNHPLYFFTNGQARLTVSTDGNVGIGTTSPGYPLDISGPVRSSHSTSNQVLVQTSGGTNAWARMWMQTTNQSWAVGTSQNFNGDQFYVYDPTFNQLRMTIQPNGGGIAFPLGNVGMGTVSPNTRLTVSGGVPWTSNGWTASMNIQNASALGWEANASGQRFGIGQSSGGLYFFRTNSAFGNTSSPANYDLSISDAGTVGVTGNATQGRDKGGFVKAMVYVTSDGVIRRCYNGVTGSSSGNCGFTVNHFANGGYGINFGFQVDDRFVVVTVQGAGNVNRGVNYWHPSPTTVDVRTFLTDELSGTVDGTFTIVVY